jgi:acyl-coenzyme A synthetase/AMP-(fatty) acid ligase
MRFGELWVMAALAVGGARARRHRTMANAYDESYRPPGKSGSIVIKLPLPPGCLPTLWNDDPGFERPDVAECAVIGVADLGYPKKTSAGSPETSP